VTAFLTELGSKLADKWLTLLVLPGVIYLAVLAAGAELGQRRALDFWALRPAINRVAGQPAAGSTGAIILAVVAAAAAAAAVALVASGLGRLTERAWTAAGDRWPASLLVGRRQARWVKADTQVQAQAVAMARAEQLEPEGPRARELRQRLNRAIARRNAIGLARPQSPTWIGDRLRAIDERVYARYGIDWAAVWPRLWLVMPDTARTELSAASDAFSASARLAAWAVLYLPIAWLWWPALLITTCLGLASWIRGRDRSVNLADLFESAIDLYARDLAKQLGLTADGPLSRAAGLAITSMIRKDPDEHDPEPEEPAPEDPAPEDPAPGLEMP
jgi:hypothetical protein